MLSTEEVARHFGVGEDTVRTWIRSGRLRGQRFNRLWRCSWEDVWAVEAAPLPRGPMREQYKQPLVTKDQIAAALGVSLRSIDRLTKEGLPTRKVLGSFRCNPSDVADWIQGQKGFTLPDGWETR